MINTLLEYMGSLLFCATALFTHGDPYLVGLSYVAGRLIAKEARIIPLTVVLDYALGRLSLWKTLHILAIQFFAVFSLVLVYRHVPE